MASTRLRRSAWTIGAAVAFVAAGIVLLPMIASTRIVRDRIASELSTIVGYRVDFADGPNLTIWPTMTAELGDVSFHAWNAAPDTPPVFEAERITLDLSAWAALRGGIEFDDAIVQRPLLRVTSEGTLALPAAPTIPGRVGYAVGSARRAIDANVASPDFSDLPDDPLGIVEFSDGRVVVVEGTAERDAITGLAGRIEWLALNRPAILSVSGIWRGEQASFSVTAPQPLVLMAGGQSNIALSFKSTPLEATYEGVASAGAGGFVDGRVTVASPSLRRLMEWSESPMSIGAASAAIEASSAVSGTAERLKFENTELVIDGNRGMGALELTMSDATPRIAGTLAFGGLDLGAFLSAFTPLRAADPENKGGVDAGFGRHVDLDLRLSASRASAGPIALENVAATAQVKDRLAVLDVSDATAFGGTVQAGVRVERRWDTNEAEMRLMATDIDAAAATAALGFDGATPRGKAQVSLTLKGLGRDWASVFESSSGPISARLGQGAIDGFDLNAFLKRVGEGKFFALSEMNGGSLPVGGAEFKADVIDGVATIETATLTTGDRTIKLAGIVPYVGRGLALSGTVAATPKEGDAAQAAQAQPPPAPVGFFVGGTWASPFVSPMVSSWSTE